MYWGAAGEVLSHPLPRQAIAEMTSLLVVLQRELGPLDTGASPGQVLASVLSIARILHSMEERARKLLEVCVWRREAGSDAATVKETVMHAVALCTSASLCLHTMAAKQAAQMVAHEHATHSLTNVHVCMRQAALAASMLLWSVYLLDAELERAPPATVTRAVSVVPAAADAEKQKSAAAQVSVQPTAASTSSPQLTAVTQTQHTHAQPEAEEVAAPEEEIDLARVRARLTADAAAAGLEVRDGYYCAEKSYTSYFSTTSHFFCVFFLFFADQGDGRGEALLLQGGGPRMARDRHGGNAVSAAQQGAG